SSFLLLSFSIILPYLIVDLKLCNRTGGTTTPDFVYIVEREDESHVYLLVETKAEGSGKRLSDEQIVAIQERFFGALKQYDVEYQEATAAQDVYDKLRKVAKLNDK
ncbi:VRR-NUC domain-containing protein, partial [Enterococcus faecalis]